MTWKKVLLTLVLALISFGAGAYYRFHAISIPDPIPVVDSDDNVPPGAIAKDDDPETSILPDQLNIAGRINLLVIGEDNVESVKRSDTMLFVAIDIDKRNVRVLSLPRDTRVPIPRRGNQKLNHAYAFGGIELLRATIERFLGTNIHYYVKIDYDNFPKLVDAIGGVDIFVGKAMKYTDRKQKLYIDIPVGKQRMDGSTALKYVRFRNDAMGDIGRIRRQQQFLKGFLHRVYETENLIRFPEIVQQIKDTVTTDMSPSLILQLGSFVRKIQDDQDKIFFKMLPGEPAIVEGLSYWIANRTDIETFLLADADTLIELSNQKDVTTASDFSPDNAEMGRRSTWSLDTNTASTADIQQMLGGISRSVAILNGTGKAGVANDIATHLQKMGVEVTHVGNAKHFDYRNCIVVYPEDADQDARSTAVALAKLCGLQEAQVRGDRQAAYPSLIVGHNFDSLMKRLVQNYAVLE